MSWWSPRVLLNLVISLSEQSSFLHEHESEDDQNERDDSSDGSSCDRSFIVTCRVALWNVEKGGYGGSESFRMSRIVGRGEVEGQIRG